MSKMINNFAGLNGFVWWIGVIEGIKDPLKLGRCQVRIFGWHTGNKKLIPTEDLPWAQTLQPANGSMTLSAPTLGDYAIGFFLDSESGQAPVVMGVLPGIQSTAPAGDSGFQDPRTAKEIAAGPQIPEGQVQRSVGQPTIAPLARGVIANSAISATNSSRSAVKDITTPVKTTIASAKAEALQFLQGLRTAKDAIIASFIAPGAGILNDAAAVPLQIASKIQAYAQEITAITDAAKSVEAAVAEAQAAVAFVESLPGAIIAEINNEVNFPGQTGGLYNNLVSEAKTQLSSLTAAQQTLTIAAATAAQQTANT
jgi:hypothetical protein